MVREKINEDYRSQWNDWQAWYGINQDSAKKQARQKQQSLQWRQYFQQYWLANVLTVVAGFFTLYSGGTENLPLFIASFLTLLVALTWGIVGLSRSQKQVDAEMLRLLRPLLELTPSEAAYVDSLIALEDNPLIEGQDRERFADGLNRLMDYDLALQSWESRVHEVQGDEIEAERLAEEHARLTALREGAEDPSARSAAEKALAMVEKRLAKRKRAVPTLERIEAERIMVRNMLKSSHSALMGFEETRAIQGTVANLNALGEQVDELGQHTEALAEAVQEVLGWSDSTIPSDQ